MKPEAVYWDKPDLADDLRQMADNLFVGMEHCLRHAMLYSAARRIEHEHSGAAELRAELQELVDLFHGYQGLELKRARATLAKYGESHD